jgi:hypothetical protein
LTQKANEPFTP